MLERFAPLVAHFQHRPSEILAFPPTVSARELPAYSRRLASKGYDLVIDLHDSLRSKVIRRAFKGSTVRRYQKPRLNRWLLFYLYINRFSNDFSVVREYLRYAGLDAPASTVPRMLCAIDRVAAVKEDFKLAEVNRLGDVVPQKHDQNQIQHDADRTCQSVLGQAMNARTMVYD